MSLHILPFVRANAIGMLNKSVLPCVSIGFENVYIHTYIHTYIYANLNLRKHSHPGNDSVTPGLFTTRSTGASSSQPCSQHSTAWPCYGASDGYSVLCVARAAAATIVAASALVKCHWRAMRYLV
jgi:hypothetical protein